jgi:hypothetical protein
MTTVNLKETIMSALIEQRTKLLNHIVSVDAYTHEEYREFLDTEIFSENDILEDSLKSLDLDIQDIDPNEFRDYQHETIQECYEKFHELKAA